MQQNIKELLNTWSDSLNIEQLKNDLNKVVGDISKFKKSIKLKSNKLLLKKKYKNILTSITKNQWYSEAKAAINLLKKTSQDFENTFAKNSITKPQKKTQLKKTGARSNSTGNHKLKFKKLKASTVK